MQRGVAVILNVFAGVVIYCGLSPPPVPLPVCGKDCCQVTAHERRRLRRSPPMALNEPTDGIIVATDDDRRMRFRMGQVGSHMVFPKPSGSSDRCCSMTLQTSFSRVRPWSMSRKCGATGRWFLTYLLLDLFARPSSGSNSTLREFSVRSGLLYQSKEPVLTVNLGVFAVREGFRQVARETVNSNVLMCL